MGPPPFPFEQCDRAHGPPPKANVTILSVAHLHTKHMAHSWHITYPLAYYSLTNCTDCRSVVPFVPGPGTAGLAEWLAGLACTPLSRSRTLHPVRTLLSAGAPSARVKRDRHSRYSIYLEIDGLESTRSTADSIDTFRIIRCVIQEDYTIESHAPPPSQPQPPAHGRRSEWNEPNARPPTTTRPASSQPQLIKQVPSGPRCDWAPPPNQPPRLRASRKLLGACVSALHWSLVAPFHPPRSRPRASHKIFCDRRPVFALLKKRGLPFIT